MRRVLETLNKALEDYGTAHRSYQQAFTDFHAVLGDTVDRAKEIGLTNPRISGHIGMVVKATRLLREASDLANAAHSKGYQMLGNAATGLTTILGLDPANARLRQTNANQNVNYDRDITPEDATRNISASTVRAGAPQTSRGNVDLQSKGRGGDAKVYRTIEENLSQTKVLGPNAASLAALWKRSAAAPNTPTLSKSAINSLRDRGIFIANPTADLKIPALIRFVQESLRARGITLSGNLEKDLRNELTAQEIDSLNKAALTAETFVGNLDRVTPTRKSANVAKAASEFLTTTERMTEADWAAYRADLAAGRLNSDMCKKVARCAGAKRGLRKTIY